VAASLDAAGKTAEATAKYEEIRKRYATSAVADQTKLALARLYEKSKPEEAYKLYDEIMKANPVQYSGLGNEAGMHQEELVKQNPALAKLREPAIPPQTPPQTMSITNLTRVTNNTPLMLNTNLLRQSMSNAAMRMTNAIRVATNAAGTNRLNLFKTPPQAKPAAPTNAPAPAAK
jgi:hypothetical protein